MKIVIIGGSAAGHNAAINLRKRYPESGITLISEEGFPFYDRRKLLDFWSGKTKEKELFLSSFDAYSQQNINFLKESKVIAVNPVRRSVSYKIGEKRTSVDYDFLVIASGGKSSLPEIEGISKTGVFRFNGLADFKELKSAVMQDAVAIIGVNHLTRSVIERVTAKQIEVKLVTREPQPEIPPGVEVIDSEVVEVIGDSGAQAIKLKEGKIIGVSWVGVMSQVEPCLDFLPVADIEKNNGALAVDDSMHTSLPDILACGSVCLKRQESPRIKSWDECQAEGLSIAEHIFKS